MNSTYETFLSDGVCPTGNKAFDFGADLNHNPHPGFSGSEMWIVVRICEISCFGGGLRSPIASLFVLDECL